MSMNMQPADPVKVTVTVETAAGMSVVHEFPNVADFRMGFVPSTVEHEPITFDAGDLPLPPAGAIDLTGIDCTYYPSPTLTSVAFTITGTAEPVESGGDIHMWRINP